MLVCHSAYPEPILDYLWDTHTHTHKHSRRYGFCSLRSISKSFESDLYAGGSQNQFIDFQHFYRLGQLTAACHFRFALSISRPSHSYLISDSYADSMIYVHRLPLPLWEAHCNCSNYEQLVSAENSSQGRCWIAKKWSSNDLMSMFRYLIIWSISYDKATLTDWWELRPMPEEIHYTAIHIISAAMRLLRLVTLY